MTAHQPPVTPSAPDPTTSPASVPRWVWMLTMMLIAINIGIITGILTYADGGSLPQAILNGGAAVAGALALEIVVALYVAAAKG